jgi:NADP-dependent 3-hydroxy acid dehydrogenase YdfG
VVTGASSGFGEATAKRLSASRATGAKDVRVPVIEPGIAEAELEDHITDAGVLEWLEVAKTQMTLLKPEDIAEAVNFVALQPARVNFQRVTIMPTRQPS